MNQEELEKLKMVYDKVAEQHQYYLSWRQFLLAGYFAIMGVIFYSTYTVVNDNNRFSNWSFAIMLCGSMLSLFFLFLDKRNRDLYHVCQRVGSKIEQTLFSDLDEKSKDNKGLFFTLDKSYKNSSNPSHSDLIDTLYIANTILTFLLCLYLFFSETMCC